jgi:hypothetical protein
MLTTYTLIFVDADFNEINQVPCERATINGVTINLILN